MGEPRSPAAPRRRRRVRQPQTLLLPVRCVGRAKRSVVNLADSLVGKFAPTPFLRPSRHRLYVNNSSEGTPACIHHVQAICRSFGRLPAADAVAVCPAPGQRRRRRTRRRSRARRRRYSAPRSSTWGPSDGPRSWPHCTCCWTMHLLTGAGAVAPTPPLPPCRARAFEAPRGGVFVCRIRGGGAGPGAR